LGGIGDGLLQRKFDDLIAKGNAVNKNEDRQKSYWDASAILNDESPSIFLFTRMFLSASTKD